MPQPEAARNVAALAPGQDVTVVIPRAMAPAGEPPDTDALVREWVNLLNVRTADTRTAVTALGDRLDRAVAERGFQSTKEIAERMDAIEDTQKLLLNLLKQSADGQDLILKLLSAPVVPKYDARGKLISAQRVVAK